MKVRQWTGGWIPAIVVDDGIIDDGNTGLYCSAALESDGEVVISYYDKTRGSLRFAHNPKPYTPPPVYFPMIIKN